MTPTQHLVSQHFSELQPKFDHSLAAATYFKIGGPAEVYLEIKELSDLAMVVKFAHTHSTPLTMLGGASNVIVADAGIRGIVIHLTNNTVTLTDHTKGSKKILLVGAGTKTALAVKASVDHGLQGLEYFLGVPGSIGGAVYNNAHYLQRLIGDHIHRVEVITATGERRWLTHAECDFQYDHSRFHTSHEVIGQIEFALEPGDKAASQALIKESTLYRAKTQPLGQPSSGCIFRNAPNTPELRKQFPQFANQPFISGGFLIDQAGLKKTRVGDIMVSDVHAAFFVNLGEGSSAQVKELVTEVKQRVFDRFGVQLQEEIFYLG